MPRAFPYTLPFEQQIDYRIECFCQTLELREEAEKIRAIKSRIFGLKTELDKKLQSMDYEALKNIIIQHELLEGKNIIILDSSNLFIKNREADELPYFLIDTGICCKIEPSRPPLTKEDVEKIEKIFKDYPKMVAHHIIRRHEEVSGGPYLEIGKGASANLYTDNWQLDLEARHINIEDPTFDIIEGFLVYKVENEDPVNIITNALNEVYRK